MRIAVLGWGSLIWDPRALPLQTGWERGGPCLPVEFARVSRARHDALTLVIEPQHGALVPTRYALSARTSLPAALEDLRQRENRPPLSQIGFVELHSHREHSSRMPQAAATVRAWAADRSLDAVIWADLPNNFAERLGRPFSLDAALHHLRSLPAPAAAAARAYIRNAPPEVVTPLRQRLLHDPWLVG